MSTESPEPAITGDDWRNWQIVSVWKGPETWTIDTSDEPVMGRTRTVRWSDEHGGVLIIEDCWTEEIEIKLPDRTITIPIKQCTERILDVDPN